VIHPEQLADGLGQPGHDLKCFAKDQRHENQWHQEQHAANGGGYE
jgi:hypothetical protein